MPRKKCIPSYRFHKARNCAVVTIDGHNSYLGPVRLPRELREVRPADRGVEMQTMQPWSRFHAGTKWNLDQGQRAGPGLLAPCQAAVCQERPAHQRDPQLQDGLAPVRQLYGSVPVTDFGPLALVACRVKLIEVGICRKRINQHIGRIRKVFKWGVGREMVPETVWRALLAIEGLRIGEAIERPPVRAVSDERIAAIEHFVTPQIWAMVNLQIWSACRPGEACIIRAIDINMQGNIWEYRPHSHKGEHHGKERVIYLGPHAQEIIKPWLTTDLHAYLFSPKEGRAWAQAQRAKNRRTPKPKKERKFQRKSQPQRAPGERYNVHAYDHAICRGCELAFGMPAELRKISKHLDADERKRLRRLAAEWRERHCWRPNQLRHTAGTRIRAAYGIELARVILGHSSVTTSQIYAELDREKAKKVMGEMG